MKRLIYTVLSIVATVGIALTLGASPAQAAPRIEITKVYYDSPGKDRGSNKSLNAEWVRLTNQRSYAINLKGWKLRDRAGHVYTFKTNFKLGPGKHLYIRTGKGSDTSKHRYWDRSWYVWNNTGDKAYLRNPGGNLVDSCKWGDGRGYTYCR